MRLGATLGGHRGLCCEAIAAWAASPHRHAGVRRVLVSGCADYAMPAHHRMLRDGGQPVFSNRLRAAPEHLQVGFSSEQAERFAELAASLCGERPTPSELDAARARAMAFAFAHHSRNYPVASVRTIADLAAHAGLQVRQCQVVQEAPMRSAIGGPTLGAGSRYVFVVLQR